MPSAATAIAGSLAKTDEEAIPPKRSAPDNPDHLERPSIPSASCVVAKVIASLTITVGLGVGAGGTKSSGLTPSPLP